MASLTSDDMHAAQALWNEWVGDGWALTVLVVGEHAPAAMDLDRPLAAIVRAGLTLRVQVHHDGVALLEEPLVVPYDGDALRRSVRVLARTIAEQ